MTKPSILFIEPSGSTNLFDNYMRLPLLGGLYLATILSNNGYDIRILNENILRRKLDPFELKADIFFSKEKTEVDPVQKHTYLKISNVR